MLRVLVVAAVLLVAGSGTLVPAYAAANNEIPIDPGCTINPFDHTWRCIDFSKCKKGPDGNPTDCPVTTGTYLQGAGASGHGRPASRPTRLRQF